MVKFDDFLQQELANDEELKKEYRNMKHSKLNIS